MRVAPTSRRFKGTVSQYHESPISIQLRTSHTKASPTIAEPMPITRKEMSWVSSTLVIARLAASGNAAKIKPSMTKTSPSAARKSDMLVAFASGMAAASSAVLPNSRAAYPRGQRNSGRSWCSAQATSACRLA